MTDIEEYISPELLVLIPVVYALGMWLKSSGSFKDKYIPLILAVFSILMAMIYEISTAGFSGEIVFTSIVQGILIASASVYANNVYKQAMKDE